uniref:Uncharacterized protein n=1 Tax=Arundo donax TaxID=35708 RepID=A0A0A9A8D4_ARUDO
MSSSWQNSHGVCWFCIGHIQSSVSCLQFRHSARFS